MTQLSCLLLIVVTSTRCRIEKFSIANNHGSRFFFLLTDMKSVSITTQPRYVLQENKNLPFQITRKQYDHQTTFKPIG